MDKSNFSLASPRHEVSRDANFEYTIFSRFETPIDTYMTRSLKNG